MNVAVLPQREWSAKALAWLASIAACTTIAAVSLIVMTVVFHYTPLREWNTVDKTFVFLFTVFASYVQLAANTLHHASVERYGDVVRGSVFDGIGSSSVNESVRQWVKCWYIGVLLWSTGIATFAGGFAVLFLSAN